MRLRGSVALLLLLAPLLAGCNATPAERDPIAARLNDGVLEVTVCTAWPLTKVLVETRSAGFVSQAVTVWQAEGSLRLSSGDVLSSTSPPAGLTASTWDEPHMAPADELFITLTGENEQTLAVILAVPMEGFPRSDWLQADGSVTESACTP